MTFDLQGRRIVITGVARGLGAALAIVAAEQGAEPILLGRDSERVGVTAAAIQARTGYAPPVVKLDLADAASVQQAGREVLDLRPELDVLINNGAAWQSGSLLEADPATLSAVIHSALTGTLLLTRSLLPALLRSPRADVVNIVSMSGLPNTPLLGASVPFYAGKHGQMAITNGLRQELMGTPVRVIGIYPPVIEAISPLDSEWDAAPQRGKQQMVTTRDVVEAVLFSITRPRNCTMASLVLDADAGGIFSQ